MSWLWKNDSSAASYEKALAKLSNQISAATVSLDKTRYRNRRAKALWTLYTSLAYLISALLLVLVVGPQQWDIPHYGGLVTGPLLIFGVRKAITAVFGWSIQRQQSQVQQLEKQREQKITDLKKATKYDSTQELLQKYGGVPSPAQNADDPKQGTKRKVKEPQPQAPVQRTGLPPPPTANIPGRNLPTLPSNSRSPKDSQGSPRTPQSMLHSPTNTDEPGFAPNAFPQAPSSRAAHEQTTHWYDRILDVMLGEDENLAKNRLVLLCQNCRQVNGQAPPGVKTVEELGRWKCQACSSWNGVQAEAAKVVKDLTAHQALPSSPTTMQHESDNATEKDAHDLDEHEGTTGLDDSPGDSNITKRVTRSSGKAETEGL